MRLITVSRFSRLMAVVLSVLTLAHTAPAFAQGESLAASCIVEMRESARRTSHAVHALAARGAQAIAAIDNQGGSDEQLTQTAESTLAAIHRRAQAGATHVNTIAGRCTARLEEIGAAPELIDRVNQARRASLGFIASAAEESAAFVRAALRRALEN